MLISHFSPGSSYFKTTDIVTNNVCKNDLESFTRAAAHRPTDTIMVKEGMSHVQKLDYMAQIYTCQVLFMIWTLSYFIVSAKFTVDFSNLIFDDGDDLSALSIIIIIRRDKIIHSHQHIDRCCKSSGWDIDLEELKHVRSYDIARESCDISKKIFMQQYVNKRKIVVLSDCIHNWKATNWTFISRYIVLLHIECHNDT